MSLCCKTKTNAPFSYNVPDKDMMKPEILPHSHVAKHGYVPQKVTRLEFSNTIFTS